MRGWLALALAPLLALVQGRIDARLGDFRSQEEVLYFWSGRQVKALSLGFDSLLADVYWLRTVQYFGGQRREIPGRKFELLEPLIDITTTLDPRLEIAYRYGAIFLCEGPPIGAGRPKEGVALLEKGEKALPDAWRLRQDRGFFIHFFLRDHARAAEVLREAVKIPGAPFWLESLAANILTKGGDRKAARQIWQQMYDQAEGGFLKTNAEATLVHLDALDQADRLAEGVAAFTKATGRAPRTLDEMARAGYARVPLVDKAGYPFEYDAATGGVTISIRSRLWRPKL